MIRLLLGLFAMLVASSAYADELRPGYIAFSETGSETGSGTWSLVWKAPITGGLPPQSRPVLPNNCRLSGPALRTLVNMAVVTTANVACEGDVAGKQIGLSGLAIAQTDVLVRVQMRGRPVQTLRLTPAEPFAEIRAKPGRWHVAQTYFVSGTEHILSGYDHLLFVVCLVLLLTGFSTIVKAVTAFTVAHSVTLIGTALGFFGLSQRPVEAVIALSIMFLAVEILKKQPGRQRVSERVPWVVAFGFGLLHGFGFAGALNEIGLPESDVPTALLAFNLGVEAGQVVIVAIACGLLALCQRVAPNLAAPAIRWSAYGIGIISAYWLIERVV